MRKLLGNLFVTKGKREHDESGSQEITPADRVRALRAKGGQDKSGHEVFNRKDRVRAAREKREQGETGPIKITPAARRGDCEHCGRSLERSSRILGIKQYCPTCDGPFSRRVLMRWLRAAFWGAVVTLGLGLIFYFIEAERNIETDPWVFYPVMWLVFTLIHALEKILPDLPG